MKSIALKNAAKCISTATSGALLQDRVLGLYFNNRAGCLTLRFQGTNAGGTVDIKCDYEEKKTCYVELDKFIKIVGLCNSDEIILDVTEKYLKISFARSNFKLNLIDFKFVPIDQKFTNKQTEISVSEISEALKPVSAWCDPASTFENVRGVFLDKSFTFTGTPGRIAAYRANPFDEKMFVYKSLADFLSCLDGTILVKTNENFLNIQIPNTLDFYFDINRKIAVPDIEKFVNLSVADSYTIPLMVLNDLVKQIAIAGCETFLLTGDSNGLRVGANGLTSEFLYDLTEKSALEFPFIYELDYRTFRDLVRFMGKDNEMEVRVDIISTDNVKAVSFIAGDFIQLLSAKVIENK
jgi:hypothetical protein